MASLQKSNSEIGRELQPSELVEKTVVLVGREDRPHLTTMWVSRIGKDFVAFHAGETRTTFLTSLQPIGVLTDDTGKRVQVYEYLGVV